MKSCRKIEADYTVATATDEEIERRIGMDAVDLEFLDDDELADIAREKPLEVAELLGRTVADEDFCL